MPGINEQYNAQQQQIIAALTKKIRKLYESSIVNVSFSAASLNVKSEKFSLSLYPLLEKTIDDQLRRINEGVYNAVKAGINQGWANGNKKTDAFVDKRLAGKRPTKKGHQILYDPNKNALNAFLNRSDKGLNLSKRVWKGTRTFKKELAQALGVGISEGKSAAKIATELKKYLNDPESLFRRVKGDDGKLKLSTTARNYNPGQGVYRSSYKNALRLTRTETNMAYRLADFNRWQTLPFVIGTEIRLSKNHPRYDICDKLVGKYPKDFVFTGFHPQCLCHQVPIMMNDAEYEQLENQILRGDAIDVQSEGQIKVPPENFKKFVRENAKRIDRWKNKPYWVRDNQKYFKDALKSKTSRGQKGEVKAAGNAIAPQFTQIDTSISQKVNRALSIIDTVHGDGILKDIPIKRVSRENVQAAFAFDRSGNPLDILLSTKATDPELSIIHEMGHYLDLYTIGKKGVFSSHTRDDFASRVVKIARKTDAIQELQSVYDLNAVVNENGVFPLHHYKREHVKYLLTDHEIFARSYAQYIATVSNNDRLMDGIKRRVAQKEASGLMYQWLKEDFVKIKEAMDEMMQELGWRINQ